MSDLPDYERVVAELTKRHGALQQDALRLLRAMREDFARACKIIEAKDKLLVAYRIGRAPGNALDYLAANQEKHAAARERLGLR